MKMRVSREIRTDLPESLLMKATSFTCTLRSVGTLQVGKVQGVPLCFAVLEAQRGMEW